MDAETKRELGFADGEFRYSTSTTSRKPRTFCSDDPLENLLEEQEDKCFDKLRLSTDQIAEETVYRGETTESSLVEVECFNQVSAGKPVFKKSKARRRSVKMKMPPKDEIEEFFSAVETDILKRSAEKYNFDFEEEQPLEGRYEWVRLENSNLKGFVALAPYQ